MSDFRDAIEAAKARLSIPALWARLDLPGSPKASCKSPFREDRRASFSVSKDGALFNDFATGEAGDAVDFLRLATGLSPEAAFRKFIEMAGGSVHKANPLPKRPAAAPQARQKPTLPAFERGSAADFTRLAQLRNLSVEGLHLASARGLLWFAELRGFDAWIVCDGARVNAQARQMDGGTDGRKWLSISCERFIAELLDLLLVIFEAFPNRALAILTQWGLPSDLIFKNLRQCRTDSI